MEIEDRGTHTAVGKITAEHVKVHITGNAAHDVASQELLALMARTLGVRLTQLMLQRGQAPRSRVLLVESLSPMQVGMRTAYSDAAMVCHCGAWDGSEYAAVKLMLGGQFILQVGAQFDLKAIHAYAWI